jgi:hypothetical protein
MGEMCLYVEFVGYPRGEAPSREGHEHVALADRRIGHFVRR